MTNDLISKQKLMKELFTEEERKNGVNLSVETILKRIEAMSCE